MTAGQITRKPVFSQVNFSFSIKNGYLTYKLTKKTIHSFCIDYEILSNMKSIVWHLNYLNDYENTAPKTSVLIYDLITL